jgi:predicted nucleotidyltransferase
MCKNNVRLTNNVLLAIIESLETFFPFNGSKVFLFGSRTDTNKKGGDIDLLIVLSDKKIIKNKLETILAFETDLIKKIGEQKIDTKIISNDELINPKTPFIKIIKNTLVKIWEYKNDC